MKDWRAKIRALKTIPKGWWTVRMLADDQRITNPSGMGGPVWIYQERKKK